MPEVYNQSVGSCAPFQGSRGGSFLASSNSDRPRHSLACGHITSISASISTWSLCLDFTLLSRTPIIAFSSLTQSEMISSQEPYLNNICKDSYSKKGLILRFQAYMSWGEVTIQPSTLRVFVQFIFSETVLLWVGLSLSCLEPVFCAHHRVWGIEGCQ